MSPEPQPWPLTAIEHSRLLRPFSTRRLSDALYHVSSTAGDVRQRETRLLVDTPTDPDEWVFELTQIQNALACLAEYCDEAHDRLDTLVRSAHVDYGRAVDAMVLVLRGMSPPPGEVGEASAPLAA